MCVCVCVCVMCMYVCVLCVYMCLCVCMCNYVSGYVGCMAYVCICVHVHMYMYLSICLCILYSQHTDIYRMGGVVCYLPLSLCTLVLSQGLLLNPKVVISFQVAFLASVFPESTWLCFLLLEVSVWRNMLIFLCGC